jgi:hypothetical protein
METASGALKPKFVGAAGARSAREPAADFRLAAHDYERSVRMTTSAEHDHGV